MFKVGEGKRTTTQQLQQQQQQQQQQQFVDEQIAKVLRRKKSWWLLSFLKQLELQKQTNELETGNEKLWKNINFK